MIVREVLPEEHDQFNAVATHPLQSWEWGEFRKKTGLKVIRLAAIDPTIESGQGKIKASYQLTVHPLPIGGVNVLYFPKGPMPDSLMLNSLQTLGVKEKAVFIKMEPNVQANSDISKFLLGNGGVVGQPLFTKYTFLLDLTPTEDQLLAVMKPKTRYNIRLAEKHGVLINEDNSPQTFETYLALTLETTKRQGFYAHNADYHRKMWETMSGAGIAHMFRATYQNQILATYIFFVFNRVLYYPYGASTRERREVMAPSLLFWEVMKWAKKQGCQKFDMWGSLGPNPDPKDPWFGFHRFKEGFGGKLIESVGTYDLVINFPYYSLYSFANNLRWKLLRLKSRLPI